MKCTFFRGVQSGCDLNRGRASPSAMLHRRRPSAMPPTARKAATLCRRQQISSPPADRQLPAWQGGPNDQGNKVGTEPTNVADVAAEVACDGFQGRRRRRRLTMMENNGIRRALSSSYGCLDNKRATVLPSASSFLWSGGGRRPPQTGRCKQQQQDLKNGLAAAAAPGPQRCSETEDRSLPRRSSRAEQAVRLTRTTTAAAAGAGGMFVVVPPPPQQPLGGGGARSPVSLSASCRRLVKSAFNLRIFSDK